MNKLSYKIINKKDKMAPSCPDFRIVIDGEETDHFFDIAELKQSSEKPGIYIIVICSCGESLCGGAEIEVIHNSDNIVWNKMRHTDYDGKNKEREFNFTQNKIGDPILIKKESSFSFDKREYKALVVKLSDEFQKL